MATRPRIGVTGNGRYWAPAWWCTALALRLAGAIPERISMHHHPSGKTLDGLIIGGGNDISPEHYGGDIDARVKLDPERDELEIHWIRHALKKNIPLLGICRGSQLINAVLGGTLHQDIRHMRLYTFNRSSLMPTKTVQLTASSKLSRITGRQQLKVNSLHHQAINQPGAGLAVVARDLDNITQAVEATDDQNILGVQWHPEYLFYLPSQFAIFRWLQSHTRHA